VAVWHTNRFQQSQRVVIVSQVPSKLAEGDSLGQPMAGAGYGPEGIHFHPCHALLGFSVKRQANGAQDARTSFAEAARWVRRRRLTWPGGFTDVEILDVYQSPSANSADIDVKRCVRS
jgi:hypothetical protein